MTAQLELGLAGGRAIIAGDGNARGWRVGDRVKCRYGVATIVEVGARIDECSSDFIAVKPDRLADQFLVQAKDLIPWR